MGHYASSCTDTKINHVGDFGYDAIPTTINFITNAITKNKRLMIMSLQGEGQMVVYPDSGAEFTMIDIKEARKHGLKIRKTAPTGKQKKTGV